MKTRTVFSARDLGMASACIRAARAAGVDDADISLVVRSDMSNMVPDERKIVENDFYPAAVRGGLGGGALGLVLGLTAVAIPPLGVTLAGALAMAVGGGLLGGWSMALAGSAIDDPIRRRFEDEIEQGRVLVVIDATGECLEAAKQAIEHEGATPLPFERPSVAS
ncbi:hypothetical protein QMK61_00275 [Fulvimonas sp. R45]|uniref:hypothetical protein n=1 Tax=Fulvimonas sp. R45 TaxID=3045937 RepID=UPI00265FFA39|nr:hypothetical protein [Fulvimonas sp. R45]MDO1527256.1 hypothetical protein [Fulvimonas sp. R45]